MISRHSTLRLVILTALSFQQVAVSQPVQGPRTDAATGTPANSAGPHKHHPTRIITLYTASSATPATKPRFKIQPVSPGETPQQAVARFSKLPGIEYAGLDFQVATTGNPPAYSSSNAKYWGQANANASGAWGMITGSPSVRLCIIDTGIDYAHDELKNRMDATYGKGVNAARCRLDTATWTWMDDVTGAACPYDGKDDNGHGTHCAGIAAAQGYKAAGTGMPGMSFGGAGLVPCKFIDSSGNGYLSDAMECVAWCGKIGAVAASNSYGGGGFDPAFEAEIRRNGAMAFVVSAGNEGLDLGKAEFYPAFMNLPTMVVVGSLDSTSAKSDFSNYGTANVHMTAPGRGIYSTYPPNTYGYLSGTSMAAPFVAGTLALMKARSLALGISKNAMDLRKALLSAGYDSVASSVGVTQPPSTGNFKRLDAGKAVAAATSHTFTATTRVATSSISTSATVAFTAPSTGTFLSTSTKELNVISSPSVNYWVVDKCSAMAAARLKASWRRNVFNLTLTGLTNGADYTLDTGCTLNSGTGPGFDTIAAVIRCPVTTSWNLALNNATCVCWVNNDGCGNRGSRVRFTFLSGSVYRYYAFVMGKSADVGLTVDSYVLRLSKA